MRFKDFIQEKSTPRPLYVCRPVMNTDDIIAWAKSQGLTSMLEPDDLHVTICYSRKAMSWDVPKTDDRITVPAISDFDEDHKPVRKMEMFGKEHNVLVIQIESPELTDRWQQFLDLGASYDFPDYKPHITISYKAAELAEDIEYIEPYRGKIIFGPEKFKAIDEEWAGEADEIDLTKPLAELISQPSDNLAEAYLEFIGDQRFLNEHTEWAGNVRVTVNPSQAQLEAMCDQYEVRGVCDDKDVFVWDAYAGIHMNVMHALGIPVDYYNNRFFAWMPSFDGRDPEDEFADSAWLDSRDNMRIEAGACIISVRGQQYHSLMNHRAFSRMVRGRRVAEEPNAQRVYRESLFESEAPPPKYFWFITQISPYAKDDDIRFAETTRKLTELATGELTGLRGISGTREIVTQMLDMKGNTAIMMPADAVMRYNEIEQVLYDDPDWLASNNCSALFRLWEKNYDEPFSRENLMINLWNDIVAAYSESSRYLGSVVDNFRSSVCKLFRDEGFRTRIETANDLSKYLHGLMERTVSDRGGYAPRQSDFEQFPLDEFSSKVGSALLRVGRRYSDEGEWLVHSDTFHIPPGSRMLVSIETDMLRRAKAGGDMEGLPSYQQYAVENAQRVLERIREYDLAGRYDLRFIPREKFERVKYGVQGRRYSRRNPPT